MRRASWKKGKKVITGRYDYDCGGDLFLIELDCVSGITGEQITTKVRGETPEFNNWKLIENFRDQGKGVHLAKA